MSFEDDSSIINTAIDNNAFDRLTKHEKSIEFCEWDVEY